MTSAPQDPLIGDTLDERYVIRSRIARGGMAMVYLASDLRLERRVAVKIMHAHLADDPNFTRRFEQEARSAARLAHPNVVNVFDQGRDAGREYLVMEYLPGITLRELLKQQRSLTAEQALEVGESVLAGLAAAHRAGIVHRDLKPENVLLADDGRIKIGDFGLARGVSANTTTGQALLGTIAYLSPELVTRGIADARSDVYAFGIMMFEMLTGEQPFTGEQPMQIAYQHAHSDIPLPSSLSDESTPELDDFVCWAAHRDPDQRPADAGEALERLQRIRSGQPRAGETRVLPLTDLTGEDVTPSTTVLDAGGQAALAASVASSAAGAAGLAGGPGAEAAARMAEPEESAEARQTAQAPIGRAREGARRRRRRGGLLALLAVLLIALAGGTGLWFGHGPGSQQTVPDLAGEEFEAASAAISDLGLSPDAAECTSLDVPVGRVVSTEPVAGERVDRGGVVRLCRSIGPEMLPVPTLVDLQQEAAVTEIEAARFAFGSVSDRIFGEQPAGTVLAALDDAGDPLPERYPEQGVVNLVVSAGPVPDVVGLSEQDAIARLEGAELVVDAEMRVEAHHDEIAEGAVIEMALGADPMRPGSPVGLTVSLGPELFEVPSVVGMNLRDAMQQLRDAGFEPSTNMPELFWGSAEVTATEPEGGAELPRGAAIQVRATISL